MPYSSWDAIPAIMNEVYRLQPKTVLDLGIGFGKFGPLLREVLDGMHGRCRMDQWTATICGSEAHADYANPTWDCYNDVWHGDFTKHLGQQHWDLVLMIDSLEHLEPGQGRAFLDELVENNRHVIISVPVVPMPQGAMYGNEFETHRTHYDGTEFSRFADMRIVYRGITQVMSIKGKLV